ncbi:hypothetical protein EDD86DRAFT_17842 [Gorgonomyces haynaldii]|nr:hypothetical protein EDD86DRAFT_17842 [Gorgonomyces haynaldii]
MKLTALFLGAAFAMQVQHQRGGETGTLIVKRGTQIGNPPQKSRETVKRGGTVVGWGLKDVQEDSAVLKKRGSGMGGGGFGKEQPATNEKRGTGSGGGGLGKEQPVTNEKRGGSIGGFGKEQPVTNEKRGDDGGMTSGGGHSKEKTQSVEKRGGAIGGSNGSHSKETTQSVEKRGSIGGTSGGNGRTTKQQKRDRSTRNINTAQWGVGNGLNAQ